MREKNLQLIKLVKDLYLYYIRNFQNKKQNYIKSWVKLLTDFRKHVCMSSLPPLLLSPRLP